RPTRSCARPATTTRRSRACTRTESFEAGNRRSFLMKTAGLVFGLALAAQAGFVSAQAWPTKPIRLIIGFPPGGGADAVARPIADALSQELGQPVIVDNRPGAGTTIAAAAAASAAPDGYTLFMHNNSAYGNLQVIYKDFKYSGKD